ncbi:glycosyltransferase [Marinobacter nauticus]|uniref:glycosyltransferase n=1 Tax=Marinobacter nauticus TaxID=2743 RepID=UPI000DF2172C|nr:glycosyltransferase [Marinobacter nauticus]
MDSGSPIRILFVIDQFVSPHAGTEGQLLQLIQNLPRERFVPELLVLRPSEHTDAGGFPCPVSVLGHSKVMSPLTWLYVIRMAVRKRAEGISVCQVFFNDSSILIPPAMFIAGIPTIISRRDMGFWYTQAYLRILRLTRRFVSHVVANSLAVKNVTVEKEGYTSNSVSVIYNGYPHDVRSDHVISEGEEQNRRRELGLPEEGRFIVLVANLREIKRINDAIKALPMVLNAVSEAQLVLIGGGDQTAYRETANQEGVLDRVHFLGARSDVKEILSVMHVGLLCSQSEGYSNAIVEYMNAKLPVVASDVGGNAEAVVHGETGYLYPCGDVSALASCLAHLLDPLTGIAERMGEAGFELAQSRHEIGHMVERHTALYEYLISKTGKASPSEVK